MRPSPSEIKAAIEKFPPLQRDSVSKQYLGHEVAWELEFRDAFHVGLGEKENEVRVHGVSARTSITFPADIKKFPWLNFLNRGQKFFVKGKIKKIDYSIELYDVEMSMDKSLDIESLKNHSLLPAQSSPIIGNVHIGDKIIGNKVTTNERVGTLRIDSSNDIKGRKDFWDKIKILSTIIVAITGIFGAPWFSSMLSDNSAERNNAILATKGGASISLVDIIEKYRRLPTSLERDNFLSQYKNERVLDTGVYTDVGKTQNELLIELKLNDEFIICKTALTQEKRINLVKLGAKITFSGEFLSVDYQGKFFVNDCQFAY